MKRKTKLLIVLGAAMVGTFALGACAHADTTYSDFGESGANVIVTFERNGGLFAGDPNIAINDVYRYGDVEAGLKLLPPGDAARGKDAASRSTITRSGYQLIGWYTERQPRAEGGKPVDDYGELCEVSGREQGYTYSGLWEFGSRALTLQDLTPQEETWGTTYRLTLYAAWTPNFSYDFYRQEEGKWVYYGSATRPTGGDIAVPAWNEETGRLDYNNVPVYSTEEMTYSLTGMYLDEALTKPLADNNMDDVTADNCSATVGATGTQVPAIPHGGSFDMQHGVGVDNVKRIYTTWRERVWYHIKTPQQFSSNLTSDGAYEILADLDFRPTVEDEEGNVTVNEVSWSGSNLSFGGVIVGNDHTIRNIAGNQENGTLTAGGVFASITEKAKIENVKFENISLTLVGTTRQGGSYGLFAGTLSADADIEGVTVSGTLHLGDLIATSNFTNYEIGLLSGNLETCGISSDNINVVVDKVEDRYDETAGGWTYKWTVKASAGADGRVTVTVNDTPGQDPNPQAN